MASVFKLFALLIIACSVSAGQQAIAQTVAASRFLSDSAQFYEAGDYKAAAEAGELHAEALKAGSEYGENHLAYAQAIQWVAVIYVAQARHADAEALCRRAIRITQQVLLPGHEGRDLPTIRLARLIAGQGRYWEAEVLLVDAVHSREAAKGQSNPSLAPVLRALLSLYETQGRKGDAKSVQDRLLGLATCSRGVSDLQNFRDALQRYEGAQIGFRHKTKHGVYDTQARNKSSKASRPVEEMIAEIRTALATLGSEKAETAALIYDGDRCVYLVSQDGVEQVAPLTAWSRSTGREITAAIRVGLNVDTRAATRVPRRRAPQPLAEAAGSGQLPGLDGADAAKMVIPHALHEKLMSGRFVRLLILPTGDLGSIPFAALPVGKQQLIDFVAPVVLADLDGLLKVDKAAQDFRSGGTFIVGDPNLAGDKVWLFPPLPGARKEARDVAALIGGQAVIGDQASKSAIRGLLAAGQKGLSFIYFATHGIADDVDPMDASFLALKDGHLLAGEIKRLKLERRPLVVMSACQTGLGKVFEGGIFGLARSWHGAGAPQVVMSLWNVDDEATRVLMMAFVRNLTGGMLAEFALRSAMIATRERYEDPALWASFAVYGRPAVSRPLQ